MGYYIIKDEVDLDELDECDDCEGLVLDEDDIEYDHDMHEAMAEDEAIDIRAEAFRSIEIDYSIPDGELDRFMFKNNPARAIEREYDIEEGELDYYFLDLE